MPMKPLRPRTKLTEEQAADVVRRWHTGQATQLELAREHEVSIDQVHGLCHGRVRPHIYKLVEAELGAAATHEPDRVAG